MVLLIITIKCTYHSGHHREEVLTNWYSLLNACATLYCILLYINILIFKVENSTRLYTYSSQNSELTVNLGDEFVYVPAGAVVGVYIPDNNNKLPIVGYTLASNPYGLCVSPTGTTSQDTTLTCSTTTWPFYYYRLHLIANIGKMIV